MDIIIEATETVPETKQILSETDLNLPVEMDIIIEETQTVPETKQILYEADLNIPVEMDIIIEATETVPETQQILSEATKTVPETKQIISETDINLPVEMDIIIEAAQTVPETKKILSEADLNLPVEKLLTPHSLKDVPSFPSSGKFESSFEYFYTMFKQLEASFLIPFSDQLIKSIKDEESILYKDSANQTIEQSQQNDISTFTIYPQFEVIEPMISQKLCVIVQRKVSKFVQMTGDDKMKIKNFQMVLFFDRKTKKLYKGTVIFNIDDIEFIENEIDQQMNDDQSLEDTIFEQELEIQFETDELSSIQDFSSFRLITPREYWYPISESLKTLVHTSLCGSIAFSDQILKGFPASEIPKYSTIEEKTDYQLAVFNEVAQLTYANSPQKKAIIHALLTESALIQGPPGTGKSFVAFEIRKLLLKLYYPKAQKPILLITKKNSTLDEQLELDLKAGHKVIRMGRQYDPKVQEISYNLLYQNFIESKKQQDDHKESNSSVSTSDEDLENLFSKMMQFLQVLNDQQKANESEGSSSPPKIDSESVLSGLRKALGLDVQESPENLEVVSDDNSTNEQSPRIKDESTESISELQEKPRLSRKELRKQQRKVERLNFMNSFQVIGMTFTGSHIHHELIEEIKPEIIIIEEASEVLEAELAPLLGPWVKHIIQIGDFKQLRPLIKFNQLVEEKNFGISYFERLITKVAAPSALLTLQRRMHPKLSVFSRQFYEKYEDDESVRKINSFDHFGGRSTYFVHHENPEGMKQPGELTNEFEAIFIVKVVNDILVQNYKNDKNENISITILTMYSAQLQLISELLEEKIKDPINKIQVSTVDSFQGLESDVILLSCVRSNPENSFRFLKDPNRINVAMSRARLGLLVIGNLEILQKKSKHWSFIIKKARETKSYSSERDNLIQRFKQYGNEIPSLLTNEKNRICNQCKEQSHLGNCNIISFFSKRMKMTIPSSKDEKGKINEFFSKRMQSFAKNT